MGENEVPALRPGAEHLRQAIVCLPIAFMAALLAFALAEPSEMLAAIATVAAILFGLIGLVRLAQGLWQRVG